MYSNSVENETPNYKNKDYRANSNILNANSQVDEEMVDESYFSQTDNGKRVESELGGDGMGHTDLDGRNADPRKRKQIKKSKSSQSRAKKLTKRPTEDAMSTDYQKFKETVEEFTRERSERIAKERLDLVESRTLFANVAKFCGLTDAIIQDRLEQDLNTIKSLISVNERSESDVYSQSPNKDSERGNRSTRGNMSNRIGTNGIRSHSDVRYTNRLRTRRTRNSVVNKF